MKKGMHAIRNIYNKLHHGQYLQWWKGENTTLPTKYDKKKRATLGAAWYGLSKSTRASSCTCFTENDSCSTSHHYVEYVWKFKEGISYGI